jgi:hypothetical protein
MDDEGFTVSYHPAQFRALVTKVLIDFDPELSSPAAINLLLGTAAQESRFGRYLRQLKGPAVGAFQMEPATFDWLRLTFGFKYIELKKRKAEEMEWDLRLATIMARLRYRADKAPLPDSDDVPGLSAYYKRVYNTPLGKATVDEFTENYARYVDAGV